MKVGRWLLALLAMMLLPVEALSASLKIEDFTIKGGETKTMVIDVNNADMEVTMVEFFMRLPSGLSVATENGDLAVDIAGRTTWRKHSLEATVADGVVHLLLYSGSNAVLTGTSGAVISVKLTAASAFAGGTITLEKQLLTAPDQTESKPATYTYQVTTGTVDDAVTIKARSYTREYGEANPAFGYDVTSGTIAAGQPVVSCSATKASPVGTYDIVISKGSVTNSTVNLVKGTLTVTRAPLTVSAGNYTRQEGEPNPTFTPTFSGFKNGETKSVLTRQPTVSCTATASSPAGTYPVTVSGAEAQNYSFSYVSGTLTVTPKSTPSADIITFADPEVKRLCVENWDTNNDGELSKQEAAAVTDLGWVFRENTTIKSFDELQFFTGIKRLDDETFSDCSNLTSIMIPNSVTCIGLNAFCFCLGLTSITIPNSVTVIENMAFQLCVGLTSVTIPNSVTSIGVNPFMSCENLKEIILQSGNANYMMVDGVLFTKDMKTLIAYPCAKEETTYSIPSSVTDIGYGAFRYCRRLVSISIPNSVTKILDRTFLGCTRLKEVTISSSVKSIEYEAFYECRNLEKVISMINEPFAIHDDVFQYHDYWDSGTDKFTSATLYVPRGTKALYEATKGWKNFTKIVEMGTQLKGDVNGDGAVDVADIATVISVMTKGTYDASADVNGDGNIDVADITEIIRAIANIQQLNESDMYPAYFGRVQLARQTTTLNETRDGFVYVISVGTENGYVVPGLIRPGTKKVEWHLEAAEKIEGSNKYNSAFYLSSEKRWVNCTAHDVYTKDYLLWYNGDEEYGRLSFEDCEQLNWDYGYKKDDHWTVYTRHYLLELASGYLWITDRANGDSLGKYGPAN